MRPTEAARAGTPALLGALAGGILAGFYGVPAGALLGVMGAEILRTQRLRAELASYLENPDSSPPPRSEPAPGAALLAGLAAAEARRLGIPPESAGQVLRDSASAPRGLAAWTARAASAVRPSGDLDRSIAVLTAAFDGRADRALRPLAADAFFALRRMNSRDLGPGEDLDTSSRLAALGVPEEEARLARARHFPDYRDDWDVLGLPPGSPTDEVRRAWKRLSRLHHPDGPAGNEEKFREAREAYERLSRARA
ncbi:MAG TPA: J domain-containing protein [Spirochaetia bacterium]|nr:J domain-containing protein [Spirochaetales bacterium]HRY80534.1 J domain-containing protein [Spirochaetia bacterium]HRZ88428.1 J domain-containing protein [Spirochaetia bacterium]